MVGLKKIVSSLVLIFLVIQNISCQDKSLKDRLTGTWGYNGRQKLFSLNAYYDRRVEIVQNDELVFHADHLEIRSGIYLLTDEEWPKGHYPWLYCGNRTVYKLAGNELSVYNPGSKTWKTFTVQMVKADSMTLTAGREIHSLVRKKKHSIPNNIKSIHLKVLDVDPFLIDYEVHVESDRIKVISDSAGQEVTSKKYVDYILKGFDQISVSDIKAVYSSETSENRILELDIEFEKGKKVHSRIIGNNYPDELKLALLPVIYAGDFINHKQYWSEIDK